MLYNLAEPQNTKTSGYTENDQVDFILSFQGRKLVANSLRLIAEVRVNNLTGEDTKDYQEFLADHSIGAHQFIEQIQTSLSNRGNIETIDAYPRFVGMVGQATKTYNEYFNSGDVCELKAPTNRIAGDYYKGVRTSTGTESIDFSIKPHFCLNNVEGETNISYDKTGDISIRLTLSRVAETFFGNNFTSTNNAYTLSDLRLSYMTVPDDGAKTGTSVLKVKETHQPRIDGSYISISSKVPQVCNGCSASFIKESHRGQDKRNTNQQEELPNIKSLQFLFNDSELRYITYEIKDKPELIERYVDSLNTVSGGNCSPQILSANQAFGVGVSFGQYLNLAQQKFTTIITSDVQSTDPYTMYLYFHGVLEL